MLWDSLTTLLINLFATAISLSLNALSITCLVLLHLLWILKETQCRKNLPQFDDCPIFSILNRLGTESDPLNFHWRGFLLISKLCFFSKPELLDQVRSFQQSAHALQVVQVFPDRNVVLVLSSVGMSGFGGQKNLPWNRGHQGGGPPLDQQAGMVGFGGGQPPVFHQGPPGPGVHHGLAGLGPMGGPSLASAVAGQQVQRAFDEVMLFLDLSTWSKSIDLFSKAFEVLI